MEPSFVQPGTIATHDRADLNRSLVVHSLSLKNGEPEVWLAIPDGMRVQKHIRVDQCSNGPHIPRDVWAPQRPRAPPPSFSMPRPQERFGLTGAPKLSFSLSSQFSF